MTGRPRAWVSGVQTLTVSHSPVVSGGSSGGPNSAASRTPSHGPGGTGAWNRSSPTGGRANGMPRKTALPCSTRPRTRPALVETSGSAEPMGATSRYVSGALTVMIFNDFRSFNRIEHHHRDLARRRLGLVLGEAGERLARPPKLSDDLAVEVVSFRRTGLCHSA